MKASIYNTLRAVQTIAIASHTATATGTSVDRHQYKNAARSASVLVHVGVITDGGFDITLEESDNNSDWATATALQGTVPATLTAATDAQVYEFGYTGNARYLRVLATESSASAGAIFGAVILLGDARREPIARA